MNDKWEFVDEGSLPNPETTVVAIVDGCDSPIILERRWEVCNPYIEPYFENFLYWEDPNNEGQDLEGRVIAWKYVGKLPTRS